VAGAASPRSPFCYDARGLMSGNTDPNRTISRANLRPPAFGACEAVLRAVYPAGLDWTVPAGNERIVVGRVTPDGSAPPLGHETVSRSHLAIEWDEKRQVHAATDLGSHNGTRINGTRAADGKNPLADGAVLQLGDVLLVYESGRGVTAPDAPEVDRQSIPGEAASMRLVRAAVARAAADPSPVLLVGETGTGKEWIAQEIHRLSGRPEPMLTINCSALSPQIIESQLFGHVRGSFTGATSDHEGLFRAADGGTLLLDEIGELPLELQPKLLRAIQEGQVQPVGSTACVTVDVRVIAATNRDLPVSIESGQFRRDLYARLALWEIRIPALRERRADVLDWIARLHRRWVERRPESANRDLKFLPDVAELLVLHDWPDNLRGLDRLIHELASSATQERPVARDDLPPWVSQEAAAEAAKPDASEKAPAQARRRPVPSREEFVEVFEKLEGNVRAMAKHFERDRRQIYRWLDAYGLADKRKRNRPPSE